MERPKPSLLAALALALSVLTACSADAPSDHSSPAARTGSLSGETRGAYFYPRFQRWTIVKVSPIPVAKVPEDLGGIPIILRGKFMYFSEGYMTVPSLNMPGDVLQPACFTVTPQGLAILTLDGRVGARNETLLLRPTGEQLTMTYGQMFDVTLRRAEPPADGGYQQRQFDSHYNERIPRERAAAPQPACEMKTVTVPPLIHHDLEWYSPETGRHVVARSADLDPQSLTQFGETSYEWRTVLGRRPENVVAQCAGLELLVRLASGNADSDSFASENFILGVIAGRLPNGEECGRVKFLRRIDPQSLLELFEISPRPDLSGMRLTDWGPAGEMRLETAGLKFELTQLDSPRIAVRLLSEKPTSPPVPVASPMVPQAFPAQVTGPPPMTETPAPAEGTQIHRRVDENGVVTYSDR